MSEFEKYIEAKYPNRSPKILFQKFKDIDGTVFYAVREIEDQAEVWSHQQAKIDDSENTRAVLYRENIDLRERNIELQKRVDGVSQVLCELKESMDGFKEMDLYDKGYRVTTEYVIADLEQALRGEHD